MFVFETSESSGGTSGSSGAVRNNLEEEVAEEPCAKDALLLHERKVKVTLHS